MKTWRLLLASLSLITLPTLALFAQNPYQGNGGWNRGYSYEGYDPSFQPYAAPAHVKQLWNGIYAVSINGHFATFNPDGTLMKAATCTPSELYHAAQALRAYRAGYRGDFYHPNYDFRDLPASAYNRYDNGLKIRVRGDGQIEVLLPMGGVALYDDRARLIQKGGTVSKSELNDANLAVHSYIRDNFKLYTTPPEVRTRGDGKLEVLMPNGGVVLYDSSGRVIQKGGTVSKSELNDANRAVQSHIRENFKPYSAPPEIRERGDGQIEVLMPNGGVVLYDNRGRLVQKGGTVTKSEFNDANRAVQAHLRENSKPYASPPEIRERGDGHVEVLMPKGGVVLYDKGGRVVQKGGTVTKSELNNANRAVHSYVRENTKPYAAPPQVRERKDGKIEVQMPKGGVVYYDNKGRLTQKGGKTS